MRLSLRIYSAAPPSPGIHRALSFDVKDALRGEPPLDIIAAGAASNVGCGADFKQTCRKDESENDDQYQKYR